MCSCGFTRPGEMTPFGQETIVAWAYAALLEQSQPTHAMSPLASYMTSPPWRTSSGPSTVPRRTFIAPAVALAFVTVQTAPGDGSILPVHSVTFGCGL